MPKRVGRPRKVGKIRGAGIMDFLRSAYGKLKSAHEFGQKYRPATKALEYFPSLANTPYLGSALTGLSTLGYGKRRRRVARK